MNTKACLLLIAAASMVLPATAAPPATRPAAPAISDAQDVLFLGTTRPVRLRMHMRIDGEPYWARRMEYVERVFRYLDRDNSGDWSDQEFKNAAPMLQYIQAYFFNNSANNGGPITFASLDGNGNGRVTLEELQRRVGPQGANSTFQYAGAYQNNVTDMASSAIFSLLDKNKDGRLSEAEVADASALMKLDINDDETLTIAELTGELYAKGGMAQSPMGGMMMPSVAPERVPFVAITHRNDPRGIVVDQSVAIEVMRQCNGGKETLSLKDTGWSEQTFKAIDADGNGAASVVEILDWLEDGPDIELVLRMGRLAAGEKRLELLASPHKEVAMAQVRATGDRLVLGNGEVQLVVGVTPETGGVQAAPNPYIQIFNMADAAQKGSVTMADLAAPQYQYLKSIFPLADHNGDGKLTFDEMNEFGDFQTQVVTLGIFQNASILGRGMMDVLDANRDGRLSRRELTSAWSRLAPFAKNGTFSKDDLPRQYQIMVGRGYGNYGNTIQQPRPVVEGPLWFQKMDRNGDGDVSEREFLGDRAAFKKLDTNNDGLISPEEAKAASK